MSKSSCIAIALVFASSGAAAEIFKCVGDTGRVTYQNFPCEIDSIGSVATQAPPVEPAPIATLPPTDAHLPLRRGQILSMAPAAAPPPAPPGEPNIGMTKGEVRASRWGEPVAMIQTEYPEGLVDVWSYSGNRSVEFDYKGRVRAVQR